MDRNLEYRMRERSLFWPIILIGVGAMWLAVNFGAQTAVPFWQLWRLWPLFLIGLGLELLIGRRVPAVGGLFGLFVVGVIAYFLFVGFNLPGVAQPEVISERLHLPVEQAQHANVDLDFWSDPVSLYALKDSNELIDANVVHSGQINFSGSGQAEKTVRLSHNNTFNPGLFWIGGQQQRADVGLTPRIPLDLNIHTSSGSSRFDLTGLQLSDLAIDSGSGSVTLTLPKTAESFMAKVDSGSGSVNVTIPDGANLGLELSSGSGSVSVRLPQNTAVQIDVRDSGSGSIHIPAGMAQTSNRGHDEGTWETPGYASAAQKVTITVVGFGSGSMSFND